MYLERSALPYSLFLYSDELDPSKEPATLIMQRAWYGVKPTGNQAGYALELLVDTMKEEYPAAVEPLTGHRYVDDVISRAADPETRELQIEQSIQVLAQGGFKFKLVVKSGEDPPEGASTDGESCKLLGYRWNSREDFLAPGLGEVNFNKKIRGAKAPNTSPIITREDAENMMKDVVLTRQAVTTRIAEFYDPAGIMEPIKLQLKLLLAKLNG